MKNENMNEAILEPGNNMQLKVTDEKSNIGIEIGSITSRGYQSAGSLQAVIKSEDSSFHFITFRGSENSITIPIRK